MKYAKTTLRKASFSNQNLWYREN